MVKTTAKAGEWVELTPEQFARINAPTVHLTPEQEAQIDADIKALRRRSAPQLLQDAADIMEERGKQYDKPEGERSMGKCVGAFNIITGHTLSEAEGWLLLQLLKDVRLWQRPGYHQDSAEDCIAYAALKAEAKQSEA